ncbi:murein L,D-transpeptidase catalytic domain family protein [Chryseobacterium sp. S0630]|uniref:murein L,D-transpeptidase catalytic domain-containing protein n=1 Tax=Chryseobacterium sp. S0630 TaxID=2957803 RepID=UPI00209EF90C|nr:murein L,D-transpeptidase catalytic domain family protein [Chryseobacterium sp. S0630]MCP1298909.1 murein L,D-transpeptidase catalytic domain family protein [Chryseobacterium sp. S0630]
MKSIFLFFTIFWICSCSQERKNNTIRTVETSVVEEKKPEADFSKLKLKAEEALEFCTSKNLSKDFCILIDMSLHSGVNRFFVWDFKNNKISKKYLVGHGCGSNSWSKDNSKENPGFSNEDGSHLSSLGKYKLEGRGYSDWGINIKYLMHGLEETNSNVLKRFIVFHSWNLMSDTETFPNGSPEGWGCPTVSNNAMKEIDPMIQKSGKPVLMWIYN